MTGPYPHIFPPKLGEILRALGSGIRDMALAGLYHEPRGSVGLPQAIETLGSYFGATPEEIKQHAESGKSMLYSTAAGMAPASYIPQTIAELGTYSAMEKRPPTPFELGLALLPGTLLGVKHLRAGSIAKEYQELYEAIVETHKKFKANPVADLASKDFLAGATAMSKSVQALQQFLKKQGIAEDQISHIVNAAIHEAIPPTVVAPAVRVPHVNQQEEDFWEYLIDRHKLSEVRHHGSYYDVSNTESMKEVLEYERRLKSQEPRRLTESSLIYGERTSQAVSRSEAFKNFKEWFGSSKVRQLNGEPRVMYHSTSSEGFREFDFTRDLGYHFGTEIHAHAFTPRRPGAFYLKLENPIELSDLGGWNGGDVVREFTDKHLRKIYDKPLYGPLDNSLMQAWAPEIAKMKRRYQIIHDSIHKLSGADLVARVKKELGYDLKPWHDPGVVGRLKEQLALRDWIKSYGYDGIQYINRIEAHPDFKSWASPQRMNLMTDAERSRLMSYIVFEPNQIKAAYSNIGLFGGTTGDFLRAIPATAGAGMYFLYQAKQIQERSNAQRN